MCDSMYLCSVVLVHICLVSIYLSGVWLHIIWFSCRQTGQARPFPEVVNHPLWRRLIGYYLCCQKPSRASTSPHQSLSVHVLPVDGAAEHDAAWCCYRRYLEKQALPAHSSITHAFHLLKLVFICVTGHFSMFKLHFKVDANAAELDIVTISLL